MHTLIENATLITPAGTVRDGYVYIEGDTIRYVGGTRPETAPGCTRLDARGGIVLPGLVNAHTHVPMTLFRGYADDVPLHTWLFDHIFPAEDKLTPEAVYWASLLAMCEMVKSGVTAFADMYFFSEDIVRALIESGLRGNVARTVTGETEEEYGPRQRDAEALYRTYNGAENGRVQVDYGVHAVYTCSAEAVRAVRDAALRDGVVVQIHVSETQKENEDCMAQYGVSPTRFLADCGLFDCPANAAHCVYLSEEDMDILAAKRAGVAHNPTSNLKLASGVADVPRMLQKGITVGLGTDGTASNNRLDILSEAKLAALLQKGVRREATAIPAADALHMATEGGARLLGRTDIGVLAPGYKADLVILDGSAPNLHPLHNAVSTVVYSAHAGNVDTVLVDGRVLLRHGELTTLDIEKILSNVYRYMDV